MEANKEELKKLTKEIIKLHKDIITLRNQFFSYYINGKTIRKATKKVGDDDWKRLLEMEEKLELKKKKEAKIIKEIYGF